MSIMKYVPNAVSSKIGRQALVVQKHSPAILFGAGVVGVVATTVVACHATLKLDEVLQSSERKMADARALHELQKSKPADEKRYDDADLKQDLYYIRVRLAWRIAKLYAPAVGVGALSIAALSGSHNILSRRNAGLASALTITSQAFEDYRRRVRDELGEDKDQQFRYAGKTKTIVEEQPSGQMKKLDVTRASEASQYARFFDETNTSWQTRPEYNRIFLANKQRHANDMLRARGHVFLNEVYDSLGFERTRAGQVMGWVDKGGEGDNFIDFGVFTRLDDSKVRDFVNGYESGILLDFNVSYVYDMINKV